MKSQAIPQWKVIKLIMGIRGRHIYHNQKQIVYASPSRTWSFVYRYNRDKILYRHGYKNMKRKRPSNEWNNIITFQKHKLMRRFDLHHLWRQKEYEQLEKMNFHDYNPAIEDIGTWKITIKNQRRKLYRLITNDPAGKLAPNITWDKLIDRVQKHHSYIVNVIDSPRNNEEMWQFNISANKVKISRRHSIQSWDHNIYENFKKLIRRFKDGI